LEGEVLRDDQWARIEPFVPGGRKGKRGPRSNGRLFVDAGVLTPENGDALRERRHAAFNGMIAVSVALDGKNRIVSGPQVRVLGLPSDDENALDDILDDLADEAEGAIKRLKGADLELDDSIETAITRAVKKASQRIWGRRPVVETTVLRI